MRDRNIPPPKKKKNQFFLKKSIFGPLRIVQRERIDNFSTPKLTFSTGPCVERNKKAISCYLKIV